MTQLKTFEIKKAGISKEQLIKKLRKIFPYADITSTKTLLNENVIYIRPKLYFKSKLISDYEMKSLFDLGNNYCFYFAILAGSVNNSDAMGDLRIRIDLEGSLVSL